MDAKEQVQGLFLTTIDELKRQGGVLWGALAEQFPPAPRPRVSVRFITDKLGVCWDNQGYKSAGALHTTQFIRFYERAASRKGQTAERFYKNHNIRHKTHWRQISEESFMEKILAACMTPRRAARALARLDAYTRWLVVREDGLKKARENLMASQGPWVSKIDARIGGAELAGVSLRLKFTETGPMSAWPMEIRQAIADNRKIDAIKHARSYLGMGLADAKSFIERGIDIIRKHSAVVVYNSRKPFYEWET